jgi:hypothetical protein
MKRIGVGVLVAGILLAVALVAWRGGARKPPGAPDAAVAQATISAPPAAPPAPASTPASAGPAATPLPPATPLPSPTAAAPGSASAEEESFRLRGRIVSAATGEPIAGAAVEQFGAGSEDPPRHATVADAAGEYELPVTADSRGSATVRVRAHGFASAARADTHAERNATRMSFTTDGGEMAIDISYGEVRIAGWKAILEQRGGRPSLLRTIEENLLNRLIPSPAVDEATGDSLPILVGEGTCRFVLGPEDELVSTELEVTRGASLRIGLAPKAGK